jgi:predicted enzyme related to lactoylglutathione lyase
MGRKNPIVHVEWHSSDAARLRSFYEACFDWKWEEAMPGYTLIQTGSKDSAAGLSQISQKNGEPPMRPGVVNYVAVGSLSDAEEKVKAAGGNVFVTHQEVPGMGALSLFRDPDGNVVGLWEPVPKKAAKKAAKAAKKAAKKAKAAKKDQKKAAKKKK